MAADERANSFLPDDQLPPVEPPSAGFIVQLFVIPALIVVIMFVIGAGIKWLVDRDNNPQAYVESLKRNTASRWQAAHDMADLLRNPRYAKLKDDAELARELAGILNKEIDDGSLDEKPIELRVYLCNLLGEFHVADVLDVLVKAAKTERSPAESAVRFAAVKGMAVWLDGAPNDADARQKLMPTILAASRNEQPLLRSTAAFALGAAGTDEAIRRLERMLVDSYPDVRFNAATMLATHGHAQAIDVLAEMLDQQQSAALEKEEESKSRDYKRDLIMVNALRATKDLAEKNSTADLAPLAAAVERLTGPSLPSGIQIQAKEVLFELNKRRS